MITADEVTSWLVQRLTNHPDRGDWLLQDVQFAFEFSCMPIDAPNFGELVRNVLREHGQMQQEEGVTQFSLHNGAVLRARYGPVERIAFFQREWPSDCEVRVVYPGNYTHVFTGFAWAYGGAGPRGLWRWLTSEGVTPMPNLSRGFGDKQGEVWSWTRQ